MFDELTSLVADSIEGADALEAAESASPSLPAPDFTGSLDYIDALSRRSAVSISRRDVAGIATGISTFDYLSPLVNPVPVPHDNGFSVSTDMRPLQDARLYSPEGVYRRPVGLSRSSSDVVSPSPRRLRSEFPPGYRNPLDPDRDLGDLNYTFGEIERRVNRHPFSFRQPDRTVICIKRRIRRGVMHALGISGLTGFRPRRRSYWSRVIC